MQTSHTDTFVLERLPPTDLQPEFRFDLPELRYAEKFNAGAELIDRAIALGFGERPAIYFPGGVWSYNDLARAANRIARVLVEDFAIRPGNRVQLRGVNGPMTAACWLAILKVGAVVVTTMPMWRSRELTYVLDKARIDLSLCEDSLVEELEGATKLAEHGKRIVSYSIDGKGDGELERAMRGKPDGFEAVETFATDPALIAFTSGTTGSAKATVHFHRDILAVADCFPRSILQTNKDDLFLCSAPMAFTFGLGGHIIFPLRYGAASVLVPPAAPARFIELAGEYKPTVLMTAPTAYRAMARTASTMDLSHVRACVSAGEHLSPSSYKLWNEATGKHIIDGIGSTEMLHIFVSSKPEDAKIGSTGRAIPGYEAMVMDDAGERAKPGEIGHLAVKGPTGCRYLDDPRQKNYVRNGWNITGDAYAMDEDGYFWFQSRTDDMIVSSGYNISGQDVEEAVMRHDAVLECAVVGVADSERGQIAKAFVVLKPQHTPSAELAARIQDFVKGDIAPYKYPRAIEFIEALPRNPSGKVQRFVLRERQTV
ncbi:MAG TPA: AMP-binding protein [Rhizomicrobium sp.]|nr:AMP-binding protein [Rhizomicrobium sp.]